MMEQKTKSSSTSFVTVIMPIRNEASHIQETLESVLAQGFPHENMEILVVDGRSTDGTRELLQSFLGKYSNIRLIDNPERIVPTALNAGLREAVGEIIVRVDGHCWLAPDYIQRCVDSLQETDADVVGGIWITQPGADSLKGKAIAIALSHPFGVGNSYYRIGSAKRRWVDTVPFGCFKREVFERFGNFDEELVRNQDDEFHARVIKHGGRILLDPKIVSYYIARDSLFKLGRMFYQYGYLKPLVVKKLGGMVTARQLAPPIFIFCLLFSAVLGIWSPFWLKNFFVIFLPYTALVIVFSRLAGIQRNAGKAWLWLNLVFPLMHWSYGIGYLKGFIDFFILKRRNRTKDRFPLSR